jgi:hypothetical protein
MESLPGSSSGDPGPSESEWAHGSESEWPTMAHKGFQVRFYIFHAELTQDRRTTKSSEVSESCAAQLEPRQG